MKATLFFLCFAYRLVSQSWVQLPDFPGTERDDGVAFVINNKAYCLTGLDVGFQCTGNGFVFDGSTETWLHGFSMPVGKERQYATAFSYNNEGYVLGGINCSNTCLADFWKYEPLSGIWTALPNFPGTPRQGMCSFVIQDKAYVIGGKLADGTILNEVWEYDLTSALWMQRNNLPVNGMWRGAGFAIDVSGYICYGLNHTQSYNHSMYSYNPFSDQWTVIPNLVLPARRYVGTAVGGNGAYLYGGQDSTGIITNDLLVFDAQDNSMLARPGIPSFGRKGGMAFILNGNFYYTTGVTNTARVKESWKATNVVGMVEAKKENRLVLYPNPVSNKLSVSITGLDAEAAVMEVYNLSGALVSSAPFSGVLDVSSFQKGMYLLLVKDQSHVYTSRFVKE